MKTPNFQDNLPYNKSSSSSSSSSSASWASMNRQRRSSRKRPEPASSPNPSIILEPSHNLFPSKDELLRLVAVLIIASLVAFACNLIANYFNYHKDNPTPKKPFCDTHFSLDPLDSFPDFCEPCPINGECTLGVLECVRGYRKHGDICVKDEDVDERAKKLVCSKNLIHSDLVEHHLCGVYAQFLCYGIGAIWVGEEDLWNHMDEHQVIESFGSDGASYWYIRNRTIDIIGRLFELRTNPDGIKEFKCPDIRAERFKPFSCRIRQWMSKHIFVIFPVCALGMASMLLVMKARRKRYLASRAEQLYCQICDILEENALASREGNGAYEPWLVASRLRDHLLLPRERRESLLWKKVEDMVQEDSRVDIYPKLVKGESKVVWEWQVEGSLSSERMKKKEEAGKLKSIGSNEANPKQEYHELRTDLELDEKFLRDEYQWVLGRNLKSYERFFGVWKTS